MHKCLLYREVGDFWTRGARAGTDLRKMCQYLAKLVHLKLTFDSPAQVSATAYLRQVTEATAP